MRKERALLALGFGLLLGCAPEPSVQPLVAVDGWTLLDHTNDVWEEHRAAHKRTCPGGFLVEDDVLEIETDTCGYVSAVQDTRVDLHAGDAIDLLTWHSALASTTAGARAHYALSFREVPFWELDVAIPASAAVYDEQIPVTEDVPAGTPLVLHLHNHGANSWRLGHLEAVPADLIDR